ncbi:hypothetical protein FAP39_12895 [Shimia litoralis]|uniref:Uncharacterized protein n=1 Tax=Shimia litoralis TaxID=420403 RepID=A0A4U7MYH4_9RHOB|nr:hypothetical protein [Shimia litoralis]TKZ18083.1 hypothetical protein FAP39_12895 [Shimia litoralis]
MAAITHVRTIDYVAKMLDEDVTLLEAIISNDDNLTYGNIISVDLGSDDTISALTNDGVEELAGMIRAARINTKTWHEFLDGFVDDSDLVTQIKTKSPR